ncbi:MAG: M48 family metalloprotease [Alicyclobacillus sp.]|nr:M48 family metalloprotease [Alicyclobacillus sp.]
MLGSENVPYKLRLWVLDQPYPNAWAFGLNQLGVTRGLMEVATDEEFAGVLAHEMGHLTARHTLITRTAWAVSAVGNIAATIVGVIGTFIGGAVAAGGVPGATSRGSALRIERIAKLLQENSQLQDTSWSPDSL